MSGCRISVAEHWWLKPEVSWVQLTVTASLFHFSLFSPHNIERFETFRLLTDILKYVKDTYSPQVTVEDHLRFVEVLQPDVFECLCDSSPSIGNKPKRVGKSVDRTLRFLDETVEARASSKVRRSVTMLVLLTDS